MFTDQSRRTFLKLASAATLGVELPRAGSRLHFVCSPGNDLFQSAVGSKARFDGAEQAIAEAEPGSGVLILADQYPDEATPFTQTLLDAATRKRLRLFIEYPEWVPGQSADIQKAASRDRAVVASNRFGSELPALHILSISDCHYVALSAPHPDLVLARVAGFDTAVYGLAETEQHAVLFEDAANSLMIATTKLSQFRTARYGPAGAWVNVWQTILQWLGGSATAPTLHGNPEMRPTYGRAQRLADACERQAFQRGAAWFSNARLLVHPSWSRQVELAKSAPDYVTSAPSRSWPSGDGRLGMLEGFSSAVDLHGNQPVRWALRADCMGEATFALALSSTLSAAPSQASVASNLVDFIYGSSALAGGPRANPTSPSFGLLNWDTNVGGMYYGDDNARCLLGMLGAAGVLRQPRWDKAILRTILANFRTTGRYGFRGECLTENQLHKNGAAFFRDVALTHYAPHFEAYPWALYLWLYSKTGYRPLLDKTLVAIAKTMAAYPDAWEWTNGIQQERARMLLPLAWLLRVEDTPQHRAWLRRMADDLLQHQHSSGGILEEVGRSATGRFGPPASNAKYGTAEAPLLQSNGDAVCDLLYTTNFAFLGLHEASAATHDPFYAQAADKLSQFLCRVQISSNTHPELDGGWFRAFAPDLWDFWASNSDKGWGAWAIESGWTQAWITSVFGMRARKTSLWTLAGSTDVAAHRNDVFAEFAPSGGM